jgi:hypothetical protein
MGISKPFMGIVTYAMSSRLLEAYCWVTNVFIIYWVVGNMFFPDDNLNIFNVYWVVGWMNDNVNSLNVLTYSMFNGFCQVDENINLFDVFWVVGNVLLAGFPPQFCDIKNLAQFSPKNRKK